MDHAAEHLRPLLGRLTNYERQRPDRLRYSLANMAALLRRPGRTPPSGLSVQVGGSKGKGTTCAYLEALALDAGMRVGVYTSPHLETLLERVRLDGTTCPLEALEEVLEELLTWAEGAGLEVTFFEAMTAAAHELFARHRVDLAVYEVGLGGRLDATTALPVDASILTTVELEHEQLLGDTVAKIAGEKSFVIRAHGHAFTTADGEALDIFEARARDVGSTLSALPAHTWPRVPGAAAVEAAAAALARAAMAHLFPAVLLPPLRRPPLPGRFEVFTAPDGGRILLDGAHTVASLAALAREIHGRFGATPGTFLISSAIDKRWREGLREILPLADRVLAMELTDTTGVPAQELGDWVQAQGVVAEVVPDPSAALEALRAAGGLRVITGSFYLVGALRPAILRWAGPPNRDP